MVSLAFPIKKLGFKSRENALVKSLIALTLFGITLYVFYRTSPIFHDSREVFRLDNKYEKIAAEKSEYDLLSDKFKKIARENRNKQRAKEARAREAACRKDITCYSDKAESFARFRCAERIEQLASHGFEWTFRSHRKIFTAYRWLDEEAGSVTMIGDAIKFQNSAGEWQQMRYECDVNPEIERVYDTSVKAAPVGAN